MSFAVEKVADVWDEAAPLLAANHIEAGALTQRDFNLDRQFYEGLDKAGCLLTYTARENGTLVGYTAMTVLKSHPHYKGTSWASQDVLYIDPSHRGPMVVRFLKDQDADLKSRGMDFSYRHNTFAKPYTRLLLHLGYRAQEVRYFKDLREEAP